MSAGTSSSSSTQYRFVFTRTRSQDTEHEKPELQLSAVDLYDDDGASILLPGTVATNPLGTTSNSHQTVGMVIDHRVDTKWLDSRYQTNGHKSVLELKLPYAHHPIASYNLWTANDVLHRDPVSWHLEMRTVDGSWVMIDTQNDFSPPAERLAPYMPTDTNFFIPETSVAGLVGWNEQRSRRSPPPPPPVALQSPLPLPPVGLVHSPPPTPQPFSLDASSLPLVESEEAPIELPEAFKPASEQALPSQQVLSTRPIEVLPSSSTVTSTTAVDSQSAPSLMVVMSLPFLLIALINVIYVWRRSIISALKSVLSEEQYERFRAQLEIQRGTGPFEWICSWLQHIWKATSDAMTRLRGDGFTRVASSGPLDSVSNFYDESEFAVDTTHSCDWGTVRSSAPMQSVAKASSSSDSESDDGREEEKYGLGSDENEGVDEDTHQDQHRKNDEDQNHGVADVVV